MFEKGSDPSPGKPKTITKSDCYKKRLSSKGSGPFSDTAPRADISSGTVYRANRMAYRPSLRISAPKNRIIQSDRCRTAADFLPAPFSWLGVP
ncbi:hypothetical protein Q31b_06830 [Novipirellula aureliae]|uniref:Uncharacterized protein n=1 Tax=Novipirellula aureliae TaxID=2527966 RepID=A0A5C6E9V7_9BACT|nr:hypothetical protein Q31b_06830 [Novipirellula aureliae]